jgi:hypothetical protein
MVLAISRTVSLNSINRLGFVAETQCVSCEVRTEFLYSIWKKFREPIAWGYKWVTLFLGEINTGSWPSRFGETQI